MLLLLRRAYAMSLLIFSFAAMLMLLAFATLPPHYFLPMLQRHTASLRHSYYAISSRRYHFHAHCHCHHPSRCHGARHHATVHYDTIAGRPHTYAPAGFFIAAIFAHAITPFISPPISPHITSSLRGRLYRSDTGYHFHIASRFVIAAEPRHRARFRPR